MNVDLANSRAQKFRFPQMSKALRAITLALAVNCAPVLAIEFEDVSATALQGRGFLAESWGVTVGDLNGDFWPDIVVGNHRTRASIYLNQGDGVLSNIVLTAGVQDITFFLNRFQDQHMFGLGDLDGDGDDDLGENRTHDVWYSNNGVFEVSGSSVSTNNMAIRATECSNDDFYPLGFDETQSFQLDFVCHRPATTFSRGTPPISHTMDLTNADFNGDGQLDVIAVRGSYYLNGANLVTPNILEAQLAQYGGVQSFSFAAQPPLNITYWERRQPRQTATLTTSGSVGQGPLQLTLSGGIWTVTGEETHVIIESATGISSLSALSNPRGSDLPLQARHLRATGGGNWQNVTQASGLGTAVQCGSIVSGDFDNDMDEDLYFGCRGGGVNIPNRLYENNGQGVFSVVPAAGGAEGVTGGSRSQDVGTTAEVATLDFDNDGFLDLFVTNGHNDLVLRLGGPQELFRNKGNANHWIQLKLRGATPDFDALGAKVTLTAGGVTQAKLQNGGVHRSSQNDQRMHFGLATNTVADFTVTWPNGQVQTFNGVAADGIYTVDQNAGINLINLQTVANVQPPSGGDDCGPPAFFGDLDQALFLYQVSCGSNVWHVRLPAGGVTNARYIGKLEADAGSTIGTVTPVSIEANDVLATSSSLVDFDLKASGGGVDGFNFVLNGDACLKLSSPSNIPVLVGSQYKRLYATGINPNTLAPCTTNIPVQLSMNDIVVDEGDGTVNATVSLSRAAPSNVSVTVFTRAGTATGGSDYYGFSRTVVIPTGQISAPVSLVVLNDQTAEPDEILTLQMINATGAVIADSDGTVTILDDDTAGGGATLSVSDVTVNEGDGTALMTVSLDQPAIASVTVFTRAGSAQGGSDYFGFTQTLSFNATQTSRSIVVPLVNDTIAESTETFQLRLINATGAQIGTPAATITIQDDD